MVLCAAQAGQRSERLSFVRAGYRKRSVLPLKKRKKDHWYMSQADINQRALGHWNAREGERYTGVDGELGVCPSYSHCFGHLG